MTHDTERSTRTWRLLGVEVAIDEPEAQVRERCMALAGVAAEQVRAMRIAHRALDARPRGRRRNVRFVIHVDLELPADHAAKASRAFERAVRSGRLVEREPPSSLLLEEVPKGVEGLRVAVVGAGPAGLFAALTLARNGAQVDLLERGPAIAERSRKLAHFLHTRELDPEANLLFGEGGAGTYSDGKIYTRVDHALETPLLDELIACGAPPEIAFDARAHIGTDRLHRILPALRQRMQQEGVRFHWGTRLEGIVTQSSDSGRVRALATSAGELPCDALVLAVGHSARDTIGRLAAQGLVLEAKPFQLGVRIEHPQPMIDAGRYGDPSLSAKLGPAYYGLVAKAGDGLPAVHSFCMCPGGQIVASVNGDGMLCTNGMSNSKHSSPYASAALVVTLTPEHFGREPMDGVRYQAALEREAFRAGGGDYTAPAQRACDFVAGRASTSVGPTSYHFGVRPERLDRILPEMVADGLRRAIGRFDRPIPGFAGEEALLVGIETRSACPFRMPRDDVGRTARGFSNLYPIGEGAGYAGGIMSAAIDGARSAHALLRSAAGSGSG
jgi:uncharacterized FAD-dependent dehydrogenase